ncbi:Uncharacterized protein involved in response to NO [gamma proteobacterium HdN1]|nr:Uncharacterized protein involved in response to NO [gamma proteobacterium HdN1]
MNHPQTARKSGLFQAPVLLVGFRPFFTLAIISGALLPLLWALVFSGTLHLPESGISATQWHAHEMLFGFGWAVLGGFLLTASKNWVGIRGMHGFPLLIAVVLWCAERVGVFYFPVPSENDSTLKLLGSLIAPNLFLIWVAGYVVQTLVRYHKKDTFKKDNYFFIIALPAFLVAKSLLLIPSTYAHGFSMSIGLFCVAFAVMFERTMPQFLKNSANIILPRKGWLDTGIKASVLLSAFESFMPTPLAVLLPSIACVLLLVRFTIWSPNVGLRRFDLALMYIGYFGLALHFGCEALLNAGWIEPFGSLSVHIFTFLCMGVIIPGMLIRISHGHTGRKISFVTLDKVGLSCMGIGAFFRLVMTQVWPAHYFLWIDLSALGWSLCFILVGYRLIPFLWQPRVDGREH